MCLCVFMILILIFLGEETIEKVQESEAISRMKDEAKHAQNIANFKLKNFKDTFSEEVKSGFKKMNEEMKKKDQ